MSAWALVPFSQLQDDQQTVAVPRAVVSPVYAELVHHIPYLSQRVVRDGHREVVYLRRRASEGAARRC